MNPSLFHRCNSPQKYFSLAGLFCYFKKSPFVVFRGLLLSFLFFSACSVFYPIYDPPQLGTIMFTSNEDCEIRLFDSQGRQVTRENYELGRAPVIVQMTSSGVFVVRAVSVGSALTPSKTFKEPITYVGGNMEYYIEF